MITIPSQKDKKWVGIHSGEFQGLLWTCFNINLERYPGYIALAERFRRTSSSADIANLGLVKNFVRSSAGSTDQWWAQSGSRMFKTAGTDASAAFAADATAPTDSQDDCFEFNGKLYVPSATDIDQLASGAWTNPWYSALTGTSALSSSIHPLGTFLNLLLIGDGRYVNTVDDSNVANDPRLTLPPEFTVRWFVKTADFAYFGTENTSSGEAEIFEWDGVSNNPNRRFKVGDAVSLAGCVRNGVVYTINGKGQILKFNGEGFVEIRRFPIMNELYSTTLRISTTDILPRGMIPYENGIAFNIIPGSANSHLPSGIWYLDLVNDQFGRLGAGNLTHRHGLGQYDNTTNYDFGQSVLAGVGALAETQDFTTRLLASAQYYDTYTATTKFGIYCRTGNDGQRGHFTTVRVPAKGAKDFYSRIQAQFKRFSSGYKIVVKAKVADSTYAITNDDYNITWVSTTTFTAVLNTGVAVGNEVEIRSGDGAGSCAHITALSATPDGAATITVTIDETMPSVSGGALARVDNFIKLGSITDTTVDSKIMYLRKFGNFIIFKVWMVGSVQSPLFESLQVDSVVYAK